MNDIDKWVRGCLGKKRYGTVKFAEKIASRAKGERGTELRVYSCLACQGFHLTKQTIERLSVANEKSLR